MHLLVNSALTPIQDAKISVAERGFRFGDGLFETIAVHDGKPYQWHFHMDRLKAGLAAIRIDYTLDSLEFDCQKLLDTNKITDGFLRIYISRGQGGQGYLPDANATPLIIVETIPYTFTMFDACTIWLSSYQKIAPQALPVQYKIAQGMQSTLAMMEAADNQCQDALMLNANGFITESTCGNICWLKDNVLYTPSTDCGMLNGSSLSALIRLSPWEVREGAYTMDDLKTADAAIITNCRLKALPVAQLKPVSFEWNSQFFAQKCYDLLMEDATKSG